MDAACPPAPAPALALLRVTAAVMALGERVAAGDEDAVAQVEELAALLGNSR